ncbi:MAG: hypothetical protein BYD32DRAFT_420552 [Podila humilis]|nr:MAG: hypothetical protein BYD32DRAFT_420552 [Podila humilis]
MMDGSIASAFSPTGPTFCTPSSPTTAPSLFSQPCCPSSSMSTDHVFRARTTLLNTITPPGRGFSQGASSPLRACLSLCSSLH